MNLLVNLPTRARPHKALDILKEYTSRAVLPSTKFIISCDEDDSTMNNPTVKEQLLDFKNTEIIFNENKITVLDSDGNKQKSDFTTKIEAINSGARGVDFDICLLASDDMHPEVDGYDAIIANDMKKYFPDTDGVLWYNDGYQADKLNTLCILGRKYYNRFNYIYHPSYITLYCDDEFTRVSKSLEKCQYIDKTIIRHKHWSHGDNDCNRDVLDQKNDMFAVYDQQNFERRKASGFK